MLSDSQRICKVIVELIETERQYVRVSEFAEFVHFVVRLVTNYNRRSCFQKF